VAAISTEVFVVAAASFRETQEMTREQTEWRMFDFIPSGFSLQERMAAIARVFVQAIASSHVMHGVTKEVAAIAHLLQECRSIRVWVAVFGK
jgi:hypothetical protein